MEMTKSKRCKREQKGKVDMYFLKTQFFGFRMFPTKIYILQL